MDFPAKESRLVIIGLKKLLEEIRRKLDVLDKTSEEFAYESNDAVLIEAMIDDLLLEYHTRFGAVHDEV